MADEQPTDKVKVANGDVEFTCSREAFDAVYAEKGFKVVETVDGEGAPESGTHAVKPRGRRGAASTSTGTEA